jgi:hypothetical protein
VLKLSSQTCHFGLRCSLTSTAGHYRSETARNPVPVGTNNNEMGKSSQSFDFALGCFLTSKIVRATSGMAREIAREANNVGDGGKLCNSIYSVCIRDVDVF